MTDLRALRIELADAWQEHDDVIARQNARASDRKKKTFDPTETQRQTERLETAAGAFAEQIGLTTNEVRELMQAFARLGWDRERALKAIEVVGVHQPSRSSSSST